VENSGWLCQSAGKFQARIRYYERRNAASKESFKAKVGSGNQRDVDFDMFLFHWPSAKLGFLFSEGASGAASGASAEISTR